MPKEPVIIAWSGGKDSALALREIQVQGEFQIAGLLTTCTEGFRRISMHGVRCSLLKAQADALGIPSHKVFVAPKCSNVEYEAKMKAAFVQFKSAGVTKIVFGDLFLEDIRRYREAMLAPIGLTPIFPLWGRDTAQLARQFIAQKFRAIVVCSKTPELAGRQFDTAFLKQLPPQIDPCGENGEFHTFVFDGPIFRAPIACRPGRIAERDHFIYADLLPATKKPNPGAIVTGGSVTKSRSSPHPNPLPKGEGTAGTRSKLTELRIIPARSETLPLPPGEGRGEGARRPKNHD